MGIITIKKNAHFRKVFARRKFSQAGPSLVLYALENEGGMTRFGFTVSKKVGKAVVRNRVRRLLKEICRLHAASFQSGKDYVIVARPRSGSRNYQQLAEELLALVQKMA